MVAPVKRRSQKSAPAWHAAFLKMLPAIVRHAKIAFRHLRGGPRGSDSGRRLQRLRRHRPLGRAGQARPGLRDRPGPLRRGPSEGRSHDRRPLELQGRLFLVLPAAEGHRRGEARSIRCRRGHLEGDRAPDVTELPWQTGKTRQTLLAMSQDRGRLVRPPYLGVKLMKRVIHRRNSYPDNAGHWRCSIALVVLLGKVSAWLLVKEPTNTFGKSKPHSR